MRKEQKENQRESKLIEWGKKQKQIKAISKYEEKEIEMKCHRKSHKWVMGSKYIYCKYCKLVKEEIKK